VTQSFVELQKLQMP